MRASIVAVILILLPPTLGIGAAAPVRGNGYVDRIYIRREKGQEVRSVIFRPDGVLLYGRGGRFGTRHLIRVGMYRIEGDTLAMFEANGHRYLSEGHQSYQAVSAATLGGGIFPVYRRLYRVRPNKALHRSEQAAPGFSPGLKRASIHPQGGWPRARM